MSVVLSIYRHSGCICVAHLMLSYLVMSWMYMWYNISGVNTCSQTKIPLFSSVFCVCLFFFVVFLACRQTFFVTGYILFGLQQVPGTMMVAYHSQDKAALIRQCVQLSTAIEEFGSCLVSLSLSFSLFLYLLHQSFIVVTVTALCSYPQHPCNLQDAGIGPHTPITHNNQSHIQDLFFFWCKDNYEVMSSF